MKFTPCPCMSLQKGTLVLAIVDLVLNGVFLFLVTLALVSFSIADPKRDGISESDRTVLGLTGIIACGFGMLIDFGQLYLAWYLRRAANENNYQACKRWLIVTLIIFVVVIINIGIQATSGSRVADLTSGGFVALLYRVYVVAVVISFMKEINNGGSSA